MGGGLESRCVGRVYGADVARQVQRGLCTGRPPAFVIILDAV